MEVVELSLLVDRVSSEVVTSEDVSSGSELVKVLVAGELGDESCTWSPGTGSGCAVIVVVCG